MENTTLIAYATKYGATREIAERIGLVLQNNGFQNAVMNVKEVNDLAAYRTIVLGSAVYIGGWRKEAVRFLKDNADLLAERLVWLFSSGPVGEGNAVELLDGWRIPEKLLPTVDKIQPRDIVVFHGSVDIEKLNFLERSMINKVSSPTGDFRDWEAITKWAETIAGELAEGHSGKV